MSSIVIFNFLYVGILLMFTYYAQVYTKEERIDGSNSGLKWSCPNIHDLMNILKASEGGNDFRYCC